MSARARQVVVGRQNVAFDDVEEFLDRHMLVEATHAGRRRAVDDGRQVLIAPQPRIGAAEADDRRRIDAGDRARWLNSALD